MAIYSIKSRQQLNWLGKKKTLSRWENKNANVDNRFLKWTWLHKMWVCGINSILREGKSARDWLITALYSCRTEALRLPITLRTREPIYLCQRTHSTLFCLRKLIRELSVKVLTFNWTCSVIMKTLGSLSKTRLQFQWVSGSYSCIYIHTVSTNALIRSPKVKTAQYVENR